MSEQLHEDENIEIPVNTPQEPQEEHQEPVEHDAPAGPVEDAPEPQEDAEAFPRAYVEKLRKENAGHRDKAKRADEYAAALWEARVTALGKLADPTDLPFPEGTDPLDAEAVTAAVEELLARKPHLASRTPRGDIGQGPSVPADSVSLAGILRSAAY